MPVLGKTKQEVLTEFRTAEILEAARRVFAERGFHEATVDDIAEAAGVAKGTVYLYYHSKRDIYWAALKHGIAALLEELEKEMAGSKTMAGKIHAFIATKMRYFEQHRDFFKIYYSEFGNAFAHPTQVHEEFKDLYNRQARLLDPVLQEGIRQKAFRNIRRGATAAVIADVTRGAITQRLLGWSKGDVENEIEFIFDMVWKGIGTR
ncbi:MAG TPA: TetR/AcrR family transcriptional regulator [Terriglobia bacterium]|nr:TetR/AcrR family transcriptional regulator [Terriglobia bacterium]